MRKASSSGRADPAVMRCVSESMRGHGVARPLMRSTTTTVSIAHSTRHASPTVRAAVYGAVAGAAFGIVGVLLDATSRTVQQLGWQSLQRPAGWAPLLGLALVGTVAVIVTQVSFQLGPLGASFPANEVAAPVVAVALGAVVLHEKVPASPAAVTAYAACLMSVLAATIWLARAWSGPENHPA